MMVANLEDLTGTIPVVIFPRSYEKYSSMLFDDAIVIIKGQGQYRFHERREKGHMRHRKAAFKGEDGQKIFHVKVEREKFGTLRSLRAFSRSKGKEPVYLHMAGK